MDSLESPRRVLAARRTGPPALRGRWEFPGGKVEPGEIPEDALMRELREELGVGVVLGAEFLAPLGDPWPISDRLEIRLWFATVVEGDPVAGDSHDELRWLDADSLESVDWLDADKQVLTHLLRSL